MRPIRLNNSWQKRDLVKTFQPYNRVPNGLSMSYISHLMCFKGNANLPAVIKVTPSGQAVAGPMATLLTPR